MSDKKTYQYVARSQDGKEIKGSMESESKVLVSQYLQSQQLTPVSIDEITKLLSWDYLKQVNIGGVPLNEKVFFMRQFATMVSAGLPLTKALEILNMQAENPRFKIVLKTVLEDISSGKSLAVAFGKYDDVFDKITVSLLEAGEKSGNLQEILIRLADEYEAKKKLAGKIQSALMYPIIVTIVMIVVVVLLMVFMVPTMAGVYEGFDAKLPLVTQILISISNFLGNPFYASLLLSTILGLFIGFKLYTKEGKGQQQWHKVLLSIPVFGTLINKTQVATFSRIFYLLIKGGMPILDALQLTSASLSNYWFKAQILQAKDEVERGRPLALSFLQSPYFPMTVGYMINVGEQTGELDKILEKLASYYDMEVEAATSSLTTIIEPIMIVVMGVVVGVVAVAIYLPMFQLTQLIK